MYNQLLSLNSHTKQLIKLAIPVIMSLVLQMTYNMIDLYWVGHISSDAVAAVGSAVFFVHLGTALCSIVSIGTMIKISQAVGAEDTEMQSKYAAASMVLGLAIGVIYVTILFVFAEQLISFLKIENEWVVEKAVLYLRIMTVGILISYINILFTAILNAHGKTKLSFKAVLCGNIINLILDPIFIFVFDWGIAGAAWATIIAWVTSFSYFYLIIYKQKMIIFQFRELQRSTYKALLKVGSAGAAQRILFTLIAIFLGKIVASFGPDAIAAQKIGLQIESLTFMIVAGIQQSLSIMVGQAHGGKRTLDINHLYFSALKIGAAIAICTTILFISFPSQLISIFVDNPETIEIGKYYIIIVGVSQIFMALEMVTGGAFNGQGLTHYSATISIIFTSIRIPLAIYLCSTSLGIFGVWWSISISSILKGIVSTIIYRIKSKKLLKANL